MAQLKSEIFKSLELKLEEMQERMIDIMAREKELKRDYYNIVVEVKELRRDYLQDIDELSQRVMECEVTIAAQDKKFSEKLRKALLEARTRIGWAYTPRRNMLFIFLSIHFTHKFRIKIVLKFQII